MKQLTGSEIELVRKAILESFSRDNFELFLRFRLNKNFKHLVSSGKKWPYEIYEVINTANRQFWHGKLIDAFLAERPYFSEIQKLSIDLKIQPQFFEGLAQTPIEKPGGMEALVRSISDTPVNDFSEKYDLIQRTTCSIRVQANSAFQYGTGFLVGPDLLLSNYHVFKSLIEHKESVEKVSCLFDYKTTNQGTEIGLADTPVVSYSPMSTLENSPNLHIDWPEDQLDYALIRLERSIGNEPYGINETGLPITYNKSDLPQEPTSPPIRRWIPITEQIPALVPNESVIFIFQHPEGKPMKVNLGHILGMANNGGRMRYNVNTNEGSSGAPCFNEKLQWVGIHNYGDPSYWAPPKYNQGIPAERIIKHLKKRGIYLTTI